MKTIFRSVMTSDFTMLPNKTLRDSRLSFKARGVLAWALSNRDDWEVTSAFLESQGKEGRLAIRSAMKELKELGYAKFERFSDGNTGKFNACLWTFFDAVDLEAGTPKGGNPPDGNTPDGNRPHKEEPSKRKLSEEENQKKEEESAVESKDGGAVRLMECWNSVCVPAGLPKVLGLKGSRLKHAAARMSEPFFISNKDAALKKLSASYFCKGKNGRGWIADFDFFVRAGTIEKIIEGKYDNRDSSKGQEVTWAV